MTRAFLKSLLTGGLAVLALWHPFGYWIRRGFEDRGAGIRPPKRRAGATTDDPFRNAPIEPR